MPVGNLGLHAVHPPPTTTDRLVRSDPHGAYLEGGLASEALEHDGANAPEVRFGVVVLGHDDLRGLGSTEQQARPFSTGLLYHGLCTMCVQPPFGSLSRLDTFNAS